MELAGNPGRRFEGHVSKKEERFFEHTQLEPLLKRYVERVSFLQTQYSLSGQVIVLENERRLETF